MAFADVNGMRLYYEEHGEGEPLLCVMGLGADHLAWVLQVQAFAERHRTVIFDNRDIGQSSYSDGPYELSHLAADALALADHLGLESFHLLGVSMGGAIAQHMALVAPERIRTLTLAVTWAGSGRYGEARSQFLARQAEHSTFEEMVDVLVLETASEEFYENADAVAYMRGVMLSNPHPQRPEGFARQALASGRHDVRGRLGALSMPVHVIGAERDVLIPSWKHAELAAEIPDARLTMLPRAPHGVQIERAAEFNAAVLDFIAAEAQDLTTTASVVLEAEPRSP